jgi:hypothetical protein
VVTKDGETRVQIEKAQLATILCVQMTSVRRRKRYEHAHASQTGRLPKWRLREGVE